MGDCFKQPINKKRILAKDASRRVAHKPRSRDTSFEIIKELSMSEASAADCSVLGDATAAASPANNVTAERIVAELKPKDVVLGRWHGSKLHTGTRRCQKLIQTHKKSYNTTSCQCLKHEIALSIWSNVEQYQCRFLHRIQQPFGASKTGGTNKSGSVIVNGSNATDGEF